MRDSIRQHRLAYLVVLLACGVVYASHGLGDLVERDNCLYHYGAQQLVRGVPPYLSIFSVKGPLTEFFTAIGVWLSQLLALDELTVMRATYVPVGVITALALYHLSAWIFRDRCVGVLAACAYLALYGLTFQTLAGARPKVLVLLFECLTLIAFARRWWLAAGLFGAAAALTWQPAALLLVVGILFGIGQRRAIVRLVVGAAIPVALVLVYFATTGAFEEFLGGSLLIHLGYFDHDRTWSDRTTMIWRSLRRGYPLLWQAVAVGFVFFVLFGVREVVTAGRERLRSPTMKLLVVTCVFGVWSAFDYQGYPDSFPLMPAAVVGLAGALWYVAKGISKLARLPAVVVHVALSVCAVVLLGCGVHLGRSRDTSSELERFAVTAQTVLDRFDAHDSFLALDAPQFLVLTKLTNPTEYIFINAGIDRYMDATIPGGIRGWIEELRRIDPNVIVVDRPRGELLQPLYDWIQEGRIRGRVGPWKVWVKAELMPTSGRR